jgi:tight adherence protein B
MGAVLGLVLGLGLLLIWRSGPRRSVRKPRATPSLNGRLSELLAQAGHPSVSPRQLVALSVVVGGVIFVLVLVLSRSPAIAMAFAAFAAYAPLALVKARRRVRMTELRDLWPDVVDNLASGIRAGMSLPEAVGQLAIRGPEHLRPAFESFAEDYRATVVSLNVSTGLRRALQIQ